MKASAIIFTLTSILHGGVGAPSSIPSDQITLSNPNLVHSFDTIRDVLKDNKIIPEVLDDFDPSYVLDIVYPATKHHAASVVDLGNDLLVKSVSHRPMFNFKHIPHLPKHVETDDTSFTLILTDPDALSRDHPVKSEMCHWIYTNISASMNGAMILAEPEVATFKSKKHSDELESYYPPAPPPKSGPHRYVFVLLKGPANRPVQKPKERPHWGYGKQRHGVRDWAEENNLQVVGANFFFASNKKQ